ASARSKASLLGFVPTMGALHEGHLTLVRKSVSENGLTLVSIFVNPTQFNETQDFEAYPKTLDEDLALVEKAGADLVFVPEVNDVYPQGLAVNGTVDPGPLALILEGKTRPGHFKGVSQIMRRFLLLA